MSLMSAIGNQFRQPHGLFGRMVARAMGRMSRAGNEWAVAALDVQPADRVLDVGFGPGYSIAMLAERASEGHVSGIDASEDMVRMASGRNRRLVEAGRVDLRAGDAFNLPYDDESFDRACTVNTVYIFESPQGIFEELHRVLRPGGRVVVAFPVAEDFLRLPPARAGAFHLHRAEDVVSMMREAGFADAELRREEGVRLGGQAVIGTRPAGEAREN